MERMFFLTASAGYTAKYPLNYSHSHQTQSIVSVFPSKHVWVMSTDGKGESYILSTKASLVGGKRYRISFHFL